MRVRYIGDMEELILSPAGHDQIVVKRMEWVDVDADVARQLNKQGGDWELESVKKAKRTRAANEAADSGEEG